MYPFCKSVNYYSSQLHSNICFILMPYNGPNTEYFLNNLSAPSHARIFRPSLFPGFQAIFWVDQIVLYLNHKSKRSSFLPKLTIQFWMKGRPSTNTQVECTERGDRDDTFWVHSFDQGICTYVWVTLCSPEKGILFPFPLPNITAR